MNKMIMRCAGSMLVVAVLVVFLVSPAAAFSGLGNGTDADPYQVWTMNQMNEVRDNLSAVYEVKTDIDLSRIPNWEPIGNISDPFTGTFNGGPFTLTNLTISAGDNAGLFGCVAGNAVIKNTVISRASIQANNYTGILAGNVSGSAVIENCSVSGTVNAGSYVGGLVGTVFSSLGNPIKITNCYFNRSGSVTASGMSVGGLIGSANASAGDITIEKCFTSAYLSATRDSVGGVLGLVEFSGSGNQVFIQNSYSKGHIYVTPSSNVGGLIGNVADNATVENCYASGNVSAANNASGLVGSVSLTSGLFTLNNSAALGYNVSGIGAVGRLIGSSTPGCTSLNTNYALDIMDAGGATDGSDVTEADAKTQAFYETTLGWNFGSIWRMIAGSHPYLQNGVSVPSHGSAENPYYIFETWDLEQFRSDLSGHFILAEDLDLSGYTTWKPIGDEPNLFTGSFEGYSFEKMHNIINMSVTRGIKSYAGFFGHVGNGAVLKNITLFNPSVTGDLYVGSLAGYIEAPAGDITVQNCSASAASVSGNNYVGGLVGNAEFGAWTNILTGSSFSGKVTAKEDYSGGLIGQYWGTGNLNLADCAADGILTSYGDNAGGFIGGIYLRDSGTLQILNSSVNETVSCLSGDGSGGFVGFVEIRNANSFTLNNCSISGILSGSTASGGVVGRLESINSNDILLDNCNANISVTSNGGYAAGLIALAKITSPASNVTISNCSVTGDVNSSTGDYVGGLIGSAEADLKAVVIQNSIYAGDTTGGSFVGGIIGNLYARPEYSLDAVIIDNCSSAGVVTSYGNMAGGVIGQANVSTDYWMLKDSSANNIVHGQSNAGGFAGGILIFNYFECSIQDCYSAPSVPTASSASVTGTLQNVGGFIGSLSTVGLSSSSCSLQNCSAAFDVSGTEITGGLIGRLTSSTGDISLKNCTSYSNIIAGGSGNAGGLIGSVTLGGTRSSLFDNCSAVGNVTGGSLTGGLIGNINANNVRTLSIERCDALGDVSGSHDTGGLIGSANVLCQNKFMILNSSAKGMVSGENRAGGFAGSIFVSGGGGFTIQNCYAVGNAAGLDVTGGFAGFVQAQNSGDRIIENIYASGMVNGNGKSGGLIGEITVPDLKNVTLQHSAALGLRVTGTDVSRVVYQSGVCLSDVDEVYALKTMEARGAYDGKDVQFSDAKKQGFYNDTLGWDFITVWQINSSVYKYPVFKWETGHINISTPCFSVVVSDKDRDITYDRVVTLPVNITDAENIDTFTIQLLASTTPDFVSVSFNETKTKNECGLSGYVINNAYSSTEKRLIWVDNSGRNNISGERTVFYLDVVVSDGAVSPVMITFTVADLGSKRESISPATYPVFPGWLTIMPMVEYTVDMNAITPAEKGFKTVDPDKYVDITVPQYSWKGQTIYLTEELLVTKYKEDKEYLVSAYINPDKTITITRDVSDADYLNIQFVGRRFGDVNNDGVVDLLDALRIAKSVVGYATLSEDDEFYADINRDGKIFGTDAVKIALFDARLVDENYNNI